MVLPRFITLTVMTEENPQPENTGDRPAPVPQQPSGQQPTGVEPRRTPQDQGSGQRRNDRRDHTRYGGRRDYHRRDQQASPQQIAPKKPSEPTGTVEDIDDEEETERDRYIRQHM